jgi:hypothetical protein
MSTWARVAALPVHVEGYDLEPLEREVSSGFTRKSTVIRLHGGGQEGVGEDVTYDAEDHEAAWQAGPSLPLAGRFTLASFSERLAEP